MSPTLSTFSSPYYFDFIYPFVGSIVIYIAFGGLDSSFALSLTSYV